MVRKLQDRFFKQAKAAGLLARSAYKLTEIQQKFRVVGPGSAVLDLGCAPGAWLQVAASCTSGIVVGVDLKECALPAGLSAAQVSTIQADVRLLGVEELQDFQPGFGTVLSDMCHPTIGTKSADAARSLDLGEAAAALSLGTGFAEEIEMNKPHHNGILVPGGNFVVKLLEGAGVGAFAARLRPNFEKLRHVRPEATRRESKEIYLVGLGRIKQQI